jgi:hypothetical protein
MKDIDFDFSIKEMLKTDEGTEVMRQILHVSEEKFDILIKRLKDNK